MSNDDVRRFLRERGRSEEEIDRELTIRTHNKFLNTSFFVAAGVGVGVAAITTPIHILQAENMIDWVENNEFLRYFANHVKGAGQAVLYTQMPNMVLGMVIEEGTENKRSKETGIFTTEPKTDHSMIMSGLLLAGGFAWEKLSEAANPAGGFDTVDMMWYGVGVAALVAFNKSVMAYAKHKFPSVYSTPPPPSLPAP